MNSLEINESATYKTEYNSGDKKKEIITYDGVSVYIVTGGDGVFYFSGEPHECHKSDMYVFSDGVPHGIFAKSGSEFPTVCTVRFNTAQWFDGESGDNESNEYCYGVFRNNAPVSYALLNSKVMDILCNYCKSAASEMNMKNHAWKTALKCMLTMLMIEIARYVNMANTVSMPHTKGWAMISAALREIEQRFGDSSMTLESIADGLYISKSHLSRRFRQITGQSFSDHVKNLRISKACELLKFTGFTNEKIVSDCGFKDVPSFYRIFKDSVGMTPYRYRMLHSSYDKNRKGGKYMIINEISENLQKGKSKIVKELVAKAVEEGVSAAQILNDGLLHGMSIIGEKFKNNEVYVPEVLVAARAMNAGVEILKPMLKDDGVEAKGKVCIGTVRGDLHDIGKNLVKMMMEGKGLEVIDLGTDVAPETFVETAIKEGCSVVCCSALLTTTMGVMEKVVKAFEDAGVRDKVKILIGGAPVTEEFCQKIGADRYTSDAASAADAAVELCTAK